MLSSLVYRKFSLQYLPDRYPGMSRLLLYLPDALVINPMCCPDILVLIHPDHLPTSGQSVFVNNQLTRDLLTVGQFYVIIAPSSGSVLDYQNQPMTDQSLSGAQWSFLLI
jgi:hypothetical protein